MSWGNLRKMIVWGFLEFYTTLDRQDEFKNKYI